MQAGLPHHFRRHGLFKNCITLTQPSKCSTQSGTQPKTKNLDQGTLRMPRQGLPSPVSSRRCPGNAHATSKMSPNGLPVHSLGSELWRKLLGTACRGGEKVRACQAHRSKGPNLEVQIPDCQPTFVRQLRRVTKIKTAFEQFCGLKSGASSTARRATRSKKLGRASTTSNENKCDSRTCRAFRSHMKDSRENCKVRVEVAQRLGKCPGHIDKILRGEVQHLLLAFMFLRSQQSNLALHCIQLLHVPAAFFGRPFALTKSPLRRRSLGPEQPAWQRTTSDS